MRKISFFENIQKKLDEYVDDHPTSHIVYSVLFVGVTFTAQIITIITSILWVSWVSYVILVLIIVALLLIDRKRIRVINNKDDNNRLLNNRNDSYHQLLDHLAQNIKIQYINKELLFRYDISKNGSCKCTRICEITPKNNTLYFFTAVLGTNNKFGIDSAMLNLSVRQSDSNGRTYPLKYFFLRDDYDFKRLCVAFHIPLEFGQTTRVEISYSWPNLWTDLLNTDNGCTDSGIITVDHEMKKVGLEIIAPHEYSITGCAINNCQENYDISIKSGRSTLKWVCNDVKENSQVRYTVFARKN